MEKEIVACLDSVESALDGLSASVSAYNPTTAFADGLMAVDTRLKHVLQELCIHQENARKLVELRAEVDAIEASNRMRLQSLANLYSELNEARLSAPKGRSVEIEELLYVAAATAKYSAPVGYKPPSMWSQSQPDQNGNQVGLQVTSDAMSPGAVGLNTAVASPEAVELDTPLMTQATQIDSSFPPTQPFTDSQPNMENPDSQPADNPGLSILSQAQLNRINPSGAAPYFPWINEQMIARSHLAKAQVPEPADEKEERPAVVAQVGTSEPKQTKNIVDERHHAQGQPQTSQPKAFSWGDDDE